MKKTIKIKFVGFWPNFNPDAYQFYESMKKNYDIEITDDPDYIVCSVFGKKFEYCKYPQIRIFFSGENYTPDFNLVDYAISPYPISFLDRHFYLPNCIDDTRRCEALEHKKRIYDMDFVKQKEYFANFIASHESENNIRGDFFKKLSKYKRVESIGSYLNNMENGEVVSYIDSSKTDFQRKCKFSLCFESTKHQGFITEKITDAFYADTIPVYYGSDTVTDFFNPKAFINCNDYASFDDVIKKIIEIDSNDDLYLNMLNQHIFADGFSPSDVLSKQEDFIRMIFDQPLEKAFRRSRCYLPQNYNDCLAGINELKRDNSFCKKLMKKMHFF